MATENNKNITYPTYKDMLRRQQVITNNVTKTNLLAKITLLVNTIKEKHS
jgi:hypothetical protein